MAVQEVTEEDFGAVVLESSIPVLVDVWGPNCGPCISLDPLMERLSDEFAGRVKIVKVVAPENRQLLRSMKVMGLPTMIAFEGGSETARIGGDKLAGSEVRALAASLAG